MRFFKDVLLPLSRTNIDALFVILFIPGWNQYLRPRLITTSNSLDVVVVAIKKMIGTGAEATDWHTVMSTTILALIPPVLVIIVMQKSFVKGLDRYRKVMVAPCRDNNFSLQAPLHIGIAPKTT